YSTTEIRSDGQDTPAFYTLYTSVRGGGNSSGSAVLSVLCSAVILESCDGGFDRSGAGRYQLPQSVAGHRCELHDDFCLLRLLHSRQTQRRRIPVDTGSSGACRFVFSERRVAIFIRVAAHQVPRLYTGLPG